eukprot:PhF_6_TR42180/c0_g1_i2/m.63786
MKAVSCLETQDLLEHIATFSDVLTVLSLTSVNHRFHQILSHESLWTFFYSRDKPNHSKRNGSAATDRTNTLLNEKTMYYRAWKQQHEQFIVWYRGTAEEIEFPFRNDPHIRHDSKHEEKMVRQYARLPEWGTLIQEGMRRRHARETQQYIIRRGQVVWFHCLCSLFAVLVVPSPVTFGVICVSAVLSALVGWLSTWYVGNIPARKLIMYQGTLSRTHRTLQCLPPLLFVLLRGTDIAVFSVFGQVVVMLFPIIFACDFINKTWPFTNDRVALTSVFWTALGLCCVLVRLTNTVSLMVMMSYAWMIHVFSGSGDFVVFRTLLAPTLVVAMHVYFGEFWVKLLGALTFILYTIGYINNVITERLTWQVSGVLKLIMKRTQDVVIWMMPGIICKGVRDGGWDAFDDVVPTENQHLARYALWIGFVMSFWGLQVLHRTIVWRAAVSWLGCAVLQCCLMLLLT